ncbi:hypothetical protein D3C72_1264740 [compost metagenome]
MAVRHGLEQLLAFGCVDQGFQARQQFHVLFDRRLYLGYGTADFVSIIGADDGDAQDTGLDIDLELYRIGQHDLGIAVIEDFFRRGIDVADAADGNKCHHDKQDNDQAETEGQAGTDFKLGHKSFILGGKRKACAGHRPADRRRPSVTMLMRSVLRYRELARQVWGRDVKGNAMDAHCRAPATGPAAYS